MIEVSLWRITLTGRMNPSDRAILSDDERTRVDRVIDPAAAARFTEMRAALRRALSQVTRQAPQSVEIREGDGRKPTVDWPVCFNVSHTRHTGLVALALGTEIGVDIEQVEPIEIPLISAFFSPKEQQALSRLPESERLRGLYRCWCRKEAFLKGLGVGLLAPLDQFSVSIDDMPRLISCEFADINSWRLMALDAGPDLEAALAVESLGQPVRILYR